MEYIAAGAFHLLCTTHANAVRASGKIVEPYALIKLAELVEAAIDKVKNNS